MYKWMIWGENPPCKETPTSTSGTFFQPTSKKLGVISPPKLTINPTYSWWLWGKTFGPVPSGHIIDTPNLKFVQEFAFSIPQEYLQVKHRKQQGRGSHQNSTGVQKLKVFNQKTHRKTQKNVHWNFGNFGAQNYLKVSKRQFFEAFLSLKVACCKHFHFAAYFHPRTTPVSFHKLVWKIHHFSWYLPMKPWGFSMVMSSFTGGEFCCFFSAILSLDILGHNHNFL